MNYLIIKVALYLGLFPLLLKLNSLFWFTSLNHSIDNQVLSIFIIKNLLLDTFILALSDALLQLPIVRKIFKLEKSKSARYNSKVMMAFIIFGALFTFFILWIQYNLGPSETDFQWLFQPSKAVQLTFILSVIVFVIAGGICARLIEKNLKTQECLEGRNRDYQKAIVQIDYLNDHLEDQIIKRTEILNQTILELEENSFFLAHDIRGPLKKLSAFCVEKSALTSLEDYRKVLSIVQKDTDEIIGLLNRLLALAAQSKGSLEITQISSKKMIMETLNRIKHLYPNNVVEVTFRGEFPFITVDEVLFKEVLYNILSNGVKFSATREQSMLQITCHEEVQFICFEFKDNGVGFDMNYYEKLFKLFNRLHHKEDFEGAGVGLCSVKKLLKNHGDAYG